MEPFIFRKISYSPIPTLPVTDNDPRGRDGRRIPHWQRDGGFDTNMGHQRQKPRNRTRRYYNADRAWRKSLRRASRPRPIEGLAAIAAMMFASL